MDKKKRHRLTRRDLGKAALLAAGLSAVGDATQAAPLPDVQDAAEVLIERALGRPIADDLRAAVHSAVKQNATTWSKQTLIIPDGTEPAFIFHPVPPQAQKHHGS
ncbi:MAG: hypothetical protein ACP5VE_06505 [Chthonomonadales bacterium]